jgi:hypothetical protein
VHFPNAFVIVGCRDCGVGPHQPSSSRLDRGTRERFHQHLGRESSRGGVRLCNAASLSSLASCNLAPEVRHSWRGGMWACGPLRSTTECEILATLYSIPVNNIPILASLKSHSTSHVTGHSEDLDPPSSCPGRVSQAVLIGRDGSLGE